MDEENCVNNQVNVNISTDANLIKVKNEQLPARDDDNETTPLRDENISWTEPAVFGTGGAGWESDANEDEAVVTPPPPSLSLDVSIKHSPSNDNALTPLREESYTDELNPIKTELKSEPSGAEPGDVADNFLDDLEAESKALEPPLNVKKEESRDLDLGFLNEFTEEFFNIPNASSRINQVTLEMPPTELHPPTESHLPTEAYLPTESHLPTESYLPTESHLPTESQPPTEPQPCNAYTEEELSKRIDDGRKQLEKLEKKKKKHKKEKKRDGHKKRRRSQSRSPHSSRKERRVDDTNKSNASRQLSMTVVKAESTVLDYIPVQNCEKTIKIISISSLSEKGSGGAAAAAAVSLPPLTVKDKRRLAVERAKSVLSLLRLQAAKAPATEFLVVDTFMKKVPSRASFTSNDIFESPSPLCNNFNVKYKFNSTNGSNIDVAKWGLQRFPTETTQLMRIAGIDAARLTQLMSNSKMELHKLRSQRAANKVEDESNNNTGLYKSVATQTSGRIGNNFQDVAIQVTSQLTQDVFWNQPHFNEINLTQQQANCMLALKEICSKMPSSSSSVDNLYNTLLRAVAIHRSGTR